MALPFGPPVAPMLARPLTAIPEGCFYEPKWDGYRTIVFRDGDDVEIGSRGERPMTRYFPDLVEAARRQLPERCVVDGEAVVFAEDGQGLDFFALQQRVHPAASRVKQLSEDTPVSFVAFDLLALGDLDLREEPFEIRRARLEEALADAGPPVHVTPATRDIDQARRWFAEFEGAGIDGIIAKDPNQPYQPGKRVQAKIKHVRTADCVVAGYRVHKSGPDRIGSLLLALYDDIGAWAGFERWVTLVDGLAPVGVSAAFSMARREELFEELQPLVTDFDRHPWGWMADTIEERKRLGQGASRWNREKDPTFVPLRPERVVEVRYDYLEGVRFRHPVQFVRWRPDRDPESCRYSQLERPVRVDLDRVIGANRPIRHE
ncbi:ATP-dependent DNA ligase [Amycolatopsis lurida]|uniref:DNA ligase (ATP) n=1 Tax=Amycolatopsis lurida NRRL 2430 TaxID=1460371 RepID=A0A2P2FII2_AMYLU|nr:ATP-dependent DNA ligase [Amycolatopsis lurida]KFU76524.1 ATP-dependent DNA ligase [Amycolatopsis lurida NRRL 2430]SEE45643.1 ATP-dependent DNA ligase [Amycolatopsis lurida]